MTQKLALSGGKAVRAKPFPKWPVFGPEERENLLRVFDSGEWWYGARVREFERRYAEFQNAKYGVAFANGSLALEAALAANSIGAGDEVIVPAYTFMATAGAVMRMNAIPVFADIEPDTCNLSAAAVEAKITSKTRALMPVHLAGLPVDMDAFGALARKHGLKLIEDACHSWGSQWKGKGTGALGDCGVFSFQMSKNITAGEGGILLTDNEELAETARSYSNCGRKKNEPWYLHFILASNLRLTELQAAILLGQLGRLREQTEQREANARYLDGQLKGVAGLGLMRRDPRVTRRSYHMYVFRHLAEKWNGVTREMFLAALQAEGIPVSSGYPAPLYKNPLFLRTGEGPRHCPFSCPYHGGTVDYRSVVCPNTEQICREACWLPHAALLGSESDMRDIAMAITKVWEQRESLLEICQKPEPLV